MTMERAQLSNGHDTNIRSLHITLTGVVLSTEASGSQPSRSFVLQIA